MDFHSALGLALPLGVGIAAIGSGIGLGGIGNGALQAMGRQPEAIAKLQTAMIIIGAFAEALTIYAFVTVFLLMGKIG
jgi:F-type H+-transporting ATPase subunit c